MPAASLLSSSTDAIKPQEMRCERRYKSPAGVRLSLQASPETGSEEAELYDISLRGLGIVTSRFLEPGFSVVLRMGARRMEAVVKHCRADRDQYRVGVLIHQATNERRPLVGGRDWDTMLTRSRRTTIAA